MREADDDAYNHHHDIDNEFARDEAVAKDPATPPAVLDDIARKPVDDSYANDRRTKNIGWAREFVASNPNTDPETLAWLATITEDSALLAAVLRHPNTPPETLRGFIDTSDQLYLTYLVENPAVDEGFICDVLKAHPDLPTVTLRALLNPALSDEAFEAIAAGLPSRFGPTVALARQRRAERPDF